MKIADIRKGQRVTDRWWPFWGRGTVERVMKTRIIIRFVNHPWRETMTYDSSHVQFLEPA